MTIEFFNKGTTDPYSDLLKISDQIVATAGVGTYNPEQKAYITDFNLLEDQLSQVLRNGENVLSQGAFSISQANHLIVFYDQKLLTKDIARHLNSIINFPFTFELIPVSQLSEGHSVEIEFWSPTFRRMLANGQLISKTFRSTQHKDFKEGFDVILEKAEAVLSMTGQDLNNVLHLRVEMPENSISQRAEVEKLYKKIFDKHNPTRTLYSGLDRSFNVQMIYKDTDF